MKDAALHPAGTVIVAEEQTAGQGRLGRSWHSQKGTGLYFSVIVAPPRPNEPQPAVTLAFGLAVQEAIQEVTGLTPDLRWPNDVLIGDRKCAGILVEWQAGKVIAGIGVNVNQTQFPDDIARIATSLRITTGREWSKDELLNSTLGAIATYLSVLRDQGTDAILRLFARGSSYVAGRRVEVEGVRGVTDGLDPTGFLWLRRDDGQRQLILAGSVRPV